MMNDRYLFRAKRIDNDEWAEGFYALIGKKHVIISKESEGYYTEFIEERHGYEIVEVDPSTICQCTGLEDKNGVLIWENDICGRKEKNAEIVTYNNGDWTLDYSYAFKRKRGTDYCNLGFYANVRKCVEVIGNIFDNPELMEQEG